MTVNWTQIFSNNSESRVEFEFHQWLNFLGQNDSTFPSVISNIYLQFFNPRELVIPQHRRHPKAIPSKDNNSQNFLEGLPQFCDETSNPKTSKIENTCSTRLDFSRNITQRLRIYIYAQSECRTLELMGQCGLRRTYSNAVNIFLDCWNSANNVDFFFHLSKAGTNPVIISAYIP